MNEKKRESMAIPYTATQLIYMGQQHITVPSCNYDHSCRICGGPLLEPAKKALEVYSGSWTDENLCRRRDQECVCAACAWFIKGNNRRSMWQGNAVIYAYESECHALTISQLYDLLKTDFELPSVFIVRGTEPSLTQKHIQWRALDAVTYDYDKTKVTFFGLQLFNESKIVGTAIFKRDDFISLTDYLCKQGKPFAETLIKYMKEKKKKKKVSEWFLANTLFQNYIQAVNSAITQDYYLAAYIASRKTAEEISEGGK